MIKNPLTRTKSAIADAYFHTAQMHQIGLVSWVEMQAMHDVYARVCQAYDALELHRYGAKAKRPPLIDTTNVALFREPEKRQDDRSAAAPRLGT